MSSARCVKDNALYLEDLCKLLEKEGYDTNQGVAIYLEPASEVAKKLAAGKANEIWCEFIYRHPTFNVPMMEIKRAKGDLFRIFMTWDMNGYCLPQIQEEPEAQEAKVGHFILETYEGSFLATTVKDSFGRIHFSVPGGSLNCAGEVPANARLLGFYYTNFKRIVPDQPIAIYVVELDDFPEFDNLHLGKKPKGGWGPNNLPVGYKKLMTYKKLLKESHDARTLAAVALYLGVLLSKEKISLIETLSNLAYFTEMSVEEAAERVVLSSSEQIEFKKEMDAMAQYL